MGDCLQTGEPSRHMTNIYLSSTFIPLRSVNRVLPYLAGVKAGYVYFCQVAGNILVYPFESFEMGFCVELYYF